MNAQPLPWRKARSLALAARCLMGIGLLGAPSGCAEPTALAVASAPLATGKVWIRLYTDEPEKLRALLSGQGEEVTGSHHEQGFVDVWMAEERQEQIRTRFAALIRGQDILPTPILGKRSFGQYHDPAAISDFMSQVQANYPDIAKKVLLEGALFEGQAIYAMKISDHVSETENEPVFLMDGQIHARELMTAEVCLDAIDTLTAQYGTDERMTRLVDGAEIWIVPVVNPDGARFAFSVDPMWRKNRHPGGAVDLNRNFSWSFRQCAGSSDEPESDTYHGSSPSSEPESRALGLLMETVRPVFYLTYHSYGEYILWPGGCAPVDEDKLLSHFGEALNERVENDAGQKGHFHTGTGSTTIYPAPGPSDDQAYGGHGAMAYTLEINSGGFQPDYNRFRDVTVRRQREAWGFLLEQTLSGPQIRGTAVDALSGKPVRARYEFRNHPFSSGQLPLHSDATGRFARACLPDSDHELVFTADGYLEERRTVHVAKQPVELEIALIPASLPACTQDSDCNPAHAQQSTCDQGLCRVDVCQEGFQDCNQMGRDGCEVDLLLLQCASPEPWDPPPPTRRAGQGHGCQSVGFDSADLPLLACLALLWGSRRWRRARTPLQPERRILSRIPLTR